MKYLWIAFCLCLVVATVAAKATSSVDVPAIRYTTPAPYPCNIAPKSEGSLVPAVCITGPETHWSCADSSRILLTAENGSKHCISFKERQ